MTREHAHSSPETVEMHLLARSVSEGYVGSVGGSKTARIVSRDITAYTLDKIRKSGQYLFIFFVVHIIVH